MDSRHRGIVRVKSSRTWSSPQQSSTDIMGGLDEATRASTPTPGSGTWWGPSSRGAMPKLPAPLFSNVIGMDFDLRLRRHPRQPRPGWKPGYRGSSAVDRACHRLRVGPSRCTTWPQNTFIHLTARGQASSSGHDPKMGRPGPPRIICFLSALSGRRVLRTFVANLVAAGFRNGWASS